MKHIRRLCGPDVRPGFVPSVSHVETRTKIQATRDIDILVLVVVQ